MGKLRKLISRETGLYLVFGVLTSVVSYVVFGLTYYWGLKAVAANTLSFLMAVAFAYVVNKQFVFESRDWSFKALRREIPPFLTARLFSFGVEQVGLFLAEDVLRLHRWSLMRLDGVMLSKIALSVITVLLNYIFSKLVFKKKK